VSVETPAVPGTTDQVDVNFNVKERPTGNLSLGAGFSSAEKLTLSASISQQNLFGSGNALSLGINTSKANRTLSLSYTNPYFTVDGVSLGYDLYHRTLDPSETTTIARYRTQSTGAGIRLGYPIGEEDTINFGLTADRTEITTYEESPIQYKEFCIEFGCSDPSGIGEVTVDSLLASAGWQKDGRDSFIYPRAGVYQRLFFEGAVPVGDLQYVKLNYQYQHWFPIGRHDALMLNADLGWADGYGGKPMPFYKNFYVGGIGTVRGFDQSGIGPKTADGDALGGTRRIVGNAEYFFPMPGSGLDRSLRVSVFLDAGSVFSMPVRSGRRKTRSTWVT